MSSQVVKVYCEIKAYICLYFSNRIGCLTNIEKKKPVHIISGSAVETGFLFFFNFVTGHFGLVCMKGKYNSYKLIYTKIALKVWKLIGTYRILIGLCPEIRVNKNPCLWNTVARLPNASHASTRHRATEGPIMDGPFGDQYKLYCKNKSEWKWTDDSFFFAMVWAMFYHTPWEALKHIP